MKTMKNYLWRLFAICAVVAVFSSCSNDDEEGGAASSIQLISDAEITCLAEQSDILKIDFSASGKWTAKASVGWIKLTKRSGEAGDNITIPFTVDGNDLFKQRVGIITVKDPATGKGVDVTVIQGEKDAKIVFTGENADGTGVKLAIDEENKQITATVKVTSNYDWSIETDNSWLTYTKESAGNGSFNVTFYADPDKLYQAGGYGQQKGIANFTYISETRSPAVKAYEVNFEGITPKLTFIEKEDGISTEFTEIFLKDVYNEGVFKKSIIVSSNVKWKLGDKPSFAKVGYNVDSDEAETQNNNSVNFFTTETVVYFDLQEGKLDTTEKLSESQKFVDANSQEVLEDALKVTCEPVGEDYVFIDAKDFPKDLNGNYGVYMFEASHEDGWSNVTKKFSVRCGNHDNMYFFIARLNSVSATLYDTYVDERGQERSTNMTGVSWQGKWGSVWPVEEEYTRSAVDTKEYEISISPRNSSEGEMGSVAEKDRYFALFAICTDYIEYEDLFDENGELKEEYQNSYIILGQKAQQIEFTFESKKLPIDGTVLEFAAEGETIEIDYVTNADPNFNGTQLFENVKVHTQGDPIATWDEDFEKVSGAWSGDCVFGSHKVISLKYEKGKILLTLKANETSKERIISAAFAIYMETQSYLVRTFTIKQPAAQ